MTSGWVCKALGPLLLVGCGDVFAQPIREADDASTAGETDAGVGTSGDATLPEAANNDAPGTAAYCRTIAPPRVAGSAYCTGDLANKFRFAACACETFSISGSLATDSFDSASDAGARAQVASVGADWLIATNSEVVLGGSLWSGGVGAQGMPAMSLDGFGTVARDLESGGDLEVGGTFAVRGNVFASGSVYVQPGDAGGSLSVGAAVHVPEGGTVSAGVAASGGILYDSVGVAPPCDCNSPIDVASIVASARTQNDNAAIGLTETALHYPAGALTLPCGRYYVGDITGELVELNIDGRVALFVDGPLSAFNALHVDMASDAELDLFVVQDVTMGVADNGAEQGNVNAPARVRLYMAGQNLNLGSSAKVGANIYAPAARVTLSRDLVVWGALFARDVSFSGNLTIHYDTSVLGAAASGCAPPGGACQTCDDCSGATPACIGGRCVACTTDRDCCTPLACNRGRCGLPLQ